VDLTAAQTEAIHTLTDFYAAMPQGWRTSGVLHDTEASIDAYRVVRKATERRMLIDWVSRQSEVVPVGLLQRVARALPALRIHQKSAAPSVRYRVDFADGSQIIVAFVWSAATPACVIDADPAQASHNLPVLIDARPLPARFDIDGHGDPTHHRKWRLQ